jgi:hypothetical protein
VFPCFFSSPLQHALKVTTQHRTCNRTFKRATFTLQVLQPVQVREQEPVQEQVHHGRCSTYRCGSA